jgi:pilus assembly protein CpaE
MKDGAMVSLMDMNLPFGEFNSSSTCTPATTGAEIIGNIGRLDATYLMSIVSRHASACTSAARHKPAGGPPDGQPENIAVLLECMRTLFDTVVVDLGMYLDEITLKVMDISDAILLVGVQNLPCLANVRRFMESIRGVEGALSDKLKVVVNRHLPDSDLSVEDMEKALGSRSSAGFPTYRPAFGHQPGPDLLEIAPGPRSPGPSGNCQGPGPRRRGEKAGGFSHPSLSAANAKI